MPKGMGYPSTHRNKLAKKGKGPKMAGGFKMHKSAKRVGMMAPGAKSRKT